MVQVFAVPVFFICFRECIECVIIVSILLAFLKQSIGPERDPVVYKRLLRQVWLGVGLAFALCLVIGGSFIGAFYALKKDIYSNTEDIWEGIFGLIASIIISVMGIGLLRVSKLQDKWRVKVAKALEKRDKTMKLGFNSRLKLWAEKYALFLLPFVTVLREGLEAIVFIGGVGLALPATSFPLAVVCGLAAGIFVGYLIYKGGNSAKLQLFLIISTCFLYLVAAGLFSKAVWSFEEHAWNQVTGSDLASLGSGPGSYNIKLSVWHVNCCNAEIDGGGGWGIFNAILGWENSATYGSVLSYNFYWIAVMIAFTSLRYYESHGHLPLMKAKAKPEEEESAGDADSSEAASQSDVSYATEKKDPEAAPASTTVRELRE